MIVAFSTSSPMVSVALIGPDGSVWVCLSEASNNNASGVALSLLGRCLAEFPGQSARLYAADTGPGSFIGARVAVTLAKTMAYSEGVQVLGASSFDLVSSDQTSVVPSRKGEFFIRRPGEEPFRAPELPSESFVGYGAGIENPVYPSAAGFARLGDLKAMDPFDLMPTYLIEPSISTPKTPYRTVGGA